MWTIFSRYDVTNEYWMLAICVLALVIMLITQPAETRMYRMTVTGFGMAILAILAHQLMLYETCKTTDFSPSAFMLYYILYCLLYITILNIIFIYISLLSYKRRHQLKQLGLMILVFSTCFILAMVYPLLAGKLYTISEDGVVRLTRWQYVMNQCGVVDAVISLIATVYARRSVSKIVSCGVYVFAPLEILILFFETMFNTVYFISYTYVLPFFVFYILFHCTKYDDIVGCQNADAIATQISKAIKHKKKYLLLNVSFPQLQKREFSSLRNLIEYISSEKCRKIERIMPGLRLYSSSVYNYYLFATIHREKSADRIIEEVAAVLNEPITYKDKTYSIYSKNIVIRNNHCFCQGL